MRKSSKCSPKRRVLAIRMVATSRLWAAIESIAPTIVCVPGICMNEHTNVRLRPEPAKALQ